MSVQCGGEGCEDFALSRKRRRTEHAEEPPARVTIDDTKEDVVMESQDTVGVVAASEADCRPASEQQQQIVDLSTEDDLDNLKASLVTHFGSVVRSREGKVVISVPEKFVRELSLWLEAEHPRTGIKELVIRNGVGELIWQSLQTYMKGEIRFNLQISLHAILSPLGGAAGSEGDTPRPDGSFYKPDVCGHVRRMTRDQRLRSIAEIAPWPQVWIEITYTDSGTDYRDAKSRLQHCVNFRNRCVYVLIGGQNTWSDDFGGRMALGELDLTAPSTPAVARAEEPLRAPKMAVWLEDAAAAAPDWYILRTNRHVDIIIPETAPPVTWRLEFNNICKCYVEDTPAAS